MDFIASSSESLACYVSKDLEAIRKSRPYTQRESTLIRENLGLSGTNSNSVVLIDNSHHHDFKENETQVLDGGYGWVVVAVAFSLSFIGTFMWATFGVYYVAYVYHFSRDKTFIPWIYTVQCFTYVISGLAFGPLFPRLGGRRLAVVSGVVMSISSLISSFAEHPITLIIGNGILAGAGYIGTTLTYTVLVQQYFSKRRTLAMGISITGMSIGMMVTPPLVNLFIDIYGWRGCLLIQSAIVLNAVPISILLRPIKFPFSRRIGKSDITITDFSSSTKKIDNRRYFHLWVFRYPKFILLTISHGLFSFAYLTPAIYLISRAIQHNVTSQEASFLLSALAVGSTVGRIALGWLGDRLNRCLLYGLAVGIAGLLTFVVSFLRSYSLSMVYSVLYGFTCGGIKVLQSPLTVDFVGVENIHRAEGFSMVTMGLLAMGATPISGWIADVTGSYDFSFLVSGIICSFAGIQMISVFIYERCTQRKP